LDKYLVIGTPISHSLSPRLHNAVYQELGLARNLEAHDPLGRAGFEQLISDLRDGYYQGFCVTIPYKVQAWHACDCLTLTAKRTGAVNYIRREDDGSLTGDNTDVQGFARAVKRELGFNFDQCRAVVCGSGGASQAIVDALLQGGAAHVSVASRNPQSTSYSASICAINYKDLYSQSEHFDLLVNATPLGMEGSTNSELMPVSADWLAANVDAVYDAVYRKKGTTPLVAAARQAGIPADDGRSMLIEQAILGMHFWGIEEDFQMLRSIIDASLDGKS